MRNSWKQNKIIYQIKELKDVFSWVRVKCMLSTILKNRYIYICYKKQTNKITFTSELINGMTLNWNVNIFRDDLYLLVLFSICSILCPLPNIFLSLLTASFSLWSIIFSHVTSSYLIYIIIILSSPNVTGKIPLVNSTNIWKRDSDWFSSSWEKKKKKNHMLKVLGH